MTRCPVCHASVSLQPAWDPAPKNRFGLLAQSTGIVCSMCSTRLRITQRWSAVAVAVLYLLAVAGLYQFREFSSLGQTQRIVFVALLLALLLLVQGRLAKAFARVQRREGIDTVDFPAETREYHDDALTDAQIEDLGNLESSGRSPWRCRTCREENPGDFELCWKCGTAISSAT